MPYAGRNVAKVLDFGHRALPLLPLLVLLTLEEQIPGAVTSVSPPKRTVHILLSPAVRSLHRNRISRDLSTPGVRSKSSLQGAVHIFLDSTAARHRDHRLAIGRC